MAANELTVWVSNEQTQQFFANALSNWGIQPEQFLTQMLFAFNDKRNWKLQKCTNSSKIKACMTCANFGLLPSLDQVALIPRKLPGDRDEYEVTVMPQWQGLKALMERHQDVKEVSAHFIMASQTYRWDPNEETLELGDVDPFSEASGLDDIKGGYLKITYTDNRKPKFHFVSKERIRKARECADTKSVWDKWFHQQAYKTLFRDGYARRVVPIDMIAEQRIQKVMEHEDTLLGNDPLRGSQVLEPAPKRSRVDSVISSMPIPDDSSEPPAIEDKPSKPRRGRKRKDEKEKEEPKPEPVAEIEHPPDVPDCMADYATKLHKCTTVEDAKQLFDANVPGHPELDSEGEAKCSLLFEWKVAQLTKPTQQSLV